MSCSAELSRKKFYNLESSLFLQVSYSDEHKNLPAGSYEVKFYDEEGYSTLKKVGCQL